ncbi:hypothetical protein [Novosphingobium sp.]|uniref:hypothetical protein n=1 Tax=Novosphingobium sp. TaxID=1874826 RepID=UPI0025DB1320|nr:hypothetical protein [Novosphingobium sp.]
MKRPKKTVKPAVEGLKSLISDQNSSPHFADFSEISETMVNGYARLVRLGMPGHTVALAMLGATVNLYRMFGLDEELPELLRGLATSIEKDVTTN